MQPDPKGVRAIACCANCGPGFQAFRVKIYACGRHRAHCAVCDQAWEALGEGLAFEPEQDQTVAQGGDESGKLVSKKKGR